MGKEKGPASKPPEMPYYAKTIVKNGLTNGGVVILEPGGSAAAAENDIRRREREESFNIRREQQLRVMAEAKKIVNGFAPETKFVIVRRDPKNPKEEVNITVVIDKDIKPKIHGRTTDKDRFVIRSEDGKHQETVNPLGLLLTTGLASREPIGEDSKETRIIFDTQKIKDLLKRYPKPADPPQPAPEQ